MTRVGLVMCCAAAWAGPLAAQVTREPSVPLHFRMIGPHRGGRATAVTGIADQPHVFFMGTTGGGVWKTDDAGAHWRNITDGFLDVGNIGAIDVADSDPEVIWVGTGSSSIRENSSVGAGVWRSTAGGRSWSFRGLKETGAIGEFIVHPQNPDVAWVAALGHPFGKNTERGVFRTIDGGDHWTRLGGGLPTGIVGKVGLAMPPANPDRLYALVEHAAQGGLYRSDDRGGTWACVSDDARVRSRPFYYGHVVPDPTDANTVWVLNTALLRSTDGGRTFEQ